MMGVLRDTAVQKLQGWMHEYDGPSKEVPALRETLGGSLRGLGWGRIQFPSITTQADGVSADQISWASPGQRSFLAPCLTSRVP